MNDPYLRFANCVQALRRSVEQVGSTLTGALGVRATIYPHQVGNIWRVLSDTRIRHLLADEVGLGKTIQALMVINALRLQDSDLSVAIVVPDNLRLQWQEELWARGHIASKFEDFWREEYGRNIEILWPEALESPAKIDPTVYSLVIVDELHNLRADIRDHITRNASRFDGILVLTATPKLHDHRRQLELMALLEPERTYLAAKAVDPSRQLDGDDPARRWPDEIQRLILENVTRSEQNAASALRGEMTWAAVDLAPPPAVAPEPAAALAWCSRRRVLRASRALFRGLLPQREHVQHIVEPTEGEIARQRHIWRYIRALPERGRVERELLARRALLGPQSIGPRIRELRQLTPELREPLDAAAARLGASEGDSRLDELIDLLAELWRSAPEERVVIACQDSLTVDYLKRQISKRITETGPFEQRRPLNIAVIRAGTSDTDLDLTGASDETARAMRLFLGGTAQILLAAEVAHVGLNLHCARVLVLYGIPWGPEEVEQWIGRLDRIGNSAIRDGEKLLPVSVHTIVQRGLIDERIVSLLSRSQVFERVLDLEDTDLIENSHQAVRRGAFADDWTTAAGQPEELEDTRTPLQSWLPYGPELAHHLYRKEAALVAMEPVLSTSADAPEAWRQREYALEAWLRLLSRSGEYDLRKGSDAEDPRSRFRTFWYKFGDQRKLLSSVVLQSPHDPRDRSPVHCETFFTRRREISQPPRQVVDLDLNFKRVQRPLQFLNHGSLLHEDLVRDWRALEHHEPPSVMTVAFPHGHPALGSPGEGMYFVTIAWADAGEHVLEAPDSEAHLLAHRADVRWLRGLLPAKTLSYVERIGDPIEVVAEEAARWSLVKPMLPEPKRHELPKTTKRSEISSDLGEELRAHKARARAFLREEVQQSWSPQLPELERALAIRAHVCAVDAAEAVAVQRARVGQAQRLHENADGAVAQITRGRLKQAQSREAAAVRAGDERRARLAAIPARTHDVALELYATHVLIVKAGPGERP